MKRRKQCSKRLTYVAIIVAVLVSTVTAGLIAGVLKRCLSSITQEEDGETTHPNVERSTLEDRFVHGQFLSRYVFNFTTADDYTVAGHREVQYCKDVTHNGTLCGNNIQFQRTVFIGARNENITTRRLSSEVYRNLHDLISWRSGTFAVDSGWERLHEIVSGLNHGVESLVDIDEERRGPARSESQTISCSHQLIYQRIATLVQSILQSSTILDQREITALANMLDALDESAMDDIKKVVTSKAVLNSFIGKELSAIMRMLAECSSSVWRSDRLYSPCAETIVVTSKYPRPVNTISKSKSGPKTFNTKYEVLDTLVLNLFSGFESDCAA